MAYTVTDPDLQMRGRGGGRSSRPGDKGGAVSKNFFLPFGPHFGRKIRGPPGPPGPPLDPPLLYKGVPPGLYRIAFRADMKAEYPVQYERIRNGTETRRSRTSNIVFRSGWLRVLCTNPDAHFEYINPSLWVPVLPLNHLFPQLS